MKAAHLPPPTQVVTTLGTDSSIPSTITAERRRHGLAVLAASKRVAYGYLVWRSLWVSSLGVLVRASNLGHGGWIRCSRFAYRCAAVLVLPCRWPGFQDSNPSAVS